MGLQCDFLARQAFSGLHVSVHLIVHATFQFGALPGQFLRVQRNVLIAGSSGGDGNEVLHPRGTTQFPPARADTADASCFLPCTDLFHLDAYAESFGQYLDELPEVHASVRDIVENGFVPVALVFHIADFHLQSQFLGNLARTYHGVVLTAFGLFVLFHVHRFGFAVHPFDFLF